MKEKPQGKSPSAIGGSVQRSVRRRLAAEISMGIGRILGQSYEWHQGTWWLFTAGEPKRELRDYEVEWHVARRHKPFVPDGISQDDPHWWDEPPNH